MSNSTPSCSVWAGRLGVVVLLLAALGAAPSEREPDPLAFFRARTLTDADRARLEVAVRKLGADSFAEREKASADLVHAGRAARPLLLSALKGGDLEVVRRVETALSRIERDCPAAQEVAAIRVLAERRPPGAVAALLAYLPVADEEAALDALLVLGSERDGAGPVLVKALTDREPTRRAAAAHVVGRVPAQRALVRRLLTDPHALVRFRAAVALAQGGDPPAVPVLVALLAEGPTDLAHKTEELLFRLAGETAPDIALGAEAASRRRCRAAWETWWKANAATAELSLLDTAGVPLGLTLVAMGKTEPDGKSSGQVVALERDGKVRWKIDGLTYLEDARLLPGGRVLIPEVGGKRVTERDRRGNILWRCDVKGYPLSCQRLPNGNTFISMHNEMIEVDRAGKTVASYSTPTGRYYRADKLRNGHILYADLHERALVELGRTGKEVRRVPLPYEHGRTQVEALPGGRYLVTQCHSARVLEIDGAGKVLRQIQVVNPICATRLCNGHTLVTSAGTVQMFEFDRNGKEVRPWPMPIQPIQVRRY